MNDKERLEAELRELEEELATAWWEEETLDRIETLEKEIDCRARQLQHCAAEN